MKDFLNRLYENHSLIFKMIIFLVSIIAIVYIFPRGGQFKYQFQKGKIWYNDDLYAPFDVAIKKSKEEINSEKNEIHQHKILYYNRIDSVSHNVVSKFIAFKNSFSSAATSTENQIYFDLGLQIIDSLYATGILDETHAVNSQNNNQGEALIKILNGNEQVLSTYRQFYTVEQKKQFIQNAYRSFTDEQLKNTWINALNRFTVPNLVFNEALTKARFEEQMLHISPYKDLIPKGTKIISKGEVIENQQFNLLTSINEQYDQLTWNNANQWWILASYLVLVAMVLLMLLLFINKYRPDVGVNTSKVAFIFTNIFLFVLVTVLVLQIDSKYLYVIPFVLLPLIIKAFLDPRVGLFTHVLTILLLGFIVPNSFEFLYIQIIAGIVTILTISELYKRANLFLSVLKITVVYIVTYIAFSITHEGNLSQINVSNIYMLLLNGLLTATLIVPMIFLYERFFGLVSDETLREFSDTNHKMLRELNEKAPGTFQHSMQVANLAEEAAKEINANALLVRTGAMYHDIGKIFNPMYFVENQSTGVNPHTELDPEESAQIIIDHVNLGIELAKKNKLPDRLIDFIRTHHGTNLVYYFYKKESEYNPEATDVNKFRYPGPIPFSKETAIVMICDATEAAAKSLKEPTAKYIDIFVDKIVKSQMDNGQFLNADITFKEIEKVKKVVKKKLKNIYHIRIEYPE